MEPVITRHVTITQPHIILAFTSDDLLSLLADEYAGGYDDYEGSDGRNEDDYGDDSNESDDADDADDDDDDDDDSGNDDDGMLGT